MIDPKSIQYSSQKLIAEFIELYGYEQFLTLASEMETLFDKHEEFMINVQKIMVCNLPIEELDECSNIKESENCYFGKWYYSLPEKLRKFDKNLERLGEYHKILHTKACDLVKEFKEKGEVSVQDYSRFEQTASIFFKLFRTFIVALDTSHLHFDRLTKLPNINAFHFVLDKEFSRVQRDDTSSCLALADLDYFKVLNDKHGHIEGDNTLRKVAGYFSDNLRKYDTVARYGGDEFIFCFPDTNTTDSMQIIERIRTNFKTSNIGITCSFGLTQINKNLTVKSNLVNADKALYISKNNGRNQTNLFDDI